MNQRLFLLALFVMCSGWLAVAEGAAPIKVLVVTGGHGFDREPFFQMFQDNPEISFVAATQGKDSSTAYDRTELLTYDVVVLYDMVQKITAEQKVKFRSLFERGVGLLVLHHALVSYQDWPEFERIIGGTYPEPQDKKGAITPELGYEHDVEIPAVIVSPHHPVTAGLKDFVLRDEIYWGYRVRADVTPLLTTTHPRSGRPLAWCRSEGKSRIVYVQLGHDAMAYRDSNYRKLLAQSIRWTARR